MCDRLTSPDEGWLPELRVSPNVLVVGQATEGGAFICNTTCSGASRRAAQGTFCSPLPLTEAVLRL